MQIRAPTFIGIIPYKKVVYINIKKWVFIRRHTHTGGVPETRRIGVPKGAKGSSQSGKTGDFPLKLDRTHRYVLV